MSVDEKLGIQLEFDLFKLDNQLGQIKSKLQNTFGDLSKLMDATKLNDTFKATNTQVEQLRKIWGTTAEDVKKRLKEMYDTEQVEKYVKKSIDQETRLRDETRRLQEKQAEEHKRIKASILAETEKAARAELAAETKKGQDIIAIYKRIDAEKRDALNKQIAQGSSTIASYRNSGFEPYNNGYIRSGYVRDVAEAHKQALKVVSDAASSQLKIEEKKGQDIAAILRRTTQEEVRARTEALRQLSALGMNKQVDYNTQAGTSGIKYKEVNGGFVRASVNTNTDVNTMAAMRREAEKMNKAFNDPSVNKFHTSLLQLLGLEAKFYGVRTALFAVTGQFKDAVSGIIQYKQTVAEIAAITTATDEETKKYAETISLLARSSKFNAQEIAGAMKVVAQSGVQRTELIPVTRAAELLAASTGDSPVAAANAITTTMNVWGIAAEKATGITNTMATVMKNSKTTISDLSTSFNYLASQAKTANMTLEETLAAVGTMRNKGIQASTVGTGLTQFLKVLEAPTPKVKKLFAEIGVSAAEVDPKVRTLGEILNTISEKGIAKYGNALALSTAISQSFEMRTGRAAKVLLDSGDAITSLTVAMRNSQSGFLALERSMEGPQVKINKIKHEFMLFVQLLGDDLMKVISGSANGLLNFTKGIQDTEVRMQLLATAIGVVIVAALNGLALVKTALLAFYSSNPILAGITAAMAAYSAVVLATAGRLEYLNKQEEEYFKRSKEFADENQRETNELNKFIGTLTKVNGKKQTLNTLTVDQKKHLEALKPAMKGMLDHLDAEIPLVTQLLGLMERLAEARGKNLINDAKSYNDIKSQSKQLKENADRMEQNIPGYTKYNPLVIAGVKANDLLAKGKKDDDPWKRSGGMAAAFGTTEPTAADTSEIERAVFLISRAKDMRDQANKLDQLIVKYDTKTGMFGRNKDGFIDTKLAEAATKTTEKDRKKEGVGEYETSEFGGSDKAGAQALSADIEAKKIRIAALRDEIATLKIDLQDEAKESEELYAIRKNIGGKLLEIQGLEQKIAEEALGKETLKGNKGDIAAVRAERLGKAQVEFDRSSKEYEKMLQDTLKKQGKNVEKIEKDALDLEIKSLKDQLPDYERDLKDTNKDKLARQAAADSILLINRKILAAEFEKELEKITEEVSKLPPSKRELYRNKLVGAAITKYNTGVDKVDSGNSDILGKSELKLTSDYYEKQYMKQMMLETKTYTLKKDQAKTAEEVRQLSIDELNNQIHMNGMLEEKYATDLKILNMDEDALLLKQAQGETLTANEQKYLNILDKAANIKEQIKEQNLELAKQKDTSFSGNFGRGTSAASKKFGTTSQITEGFGDSLITTFEANTETAMNKMIESLKKGENAWKSFREGLGDILKGISDELQKYIVKLMAVALAKQIAGIAAGVAETGMSGYGGYASGGEWGSNVSGSSTFSGPVQPHTGGLVTFKGLSKFADGGLAKGGIKGKDSIPALIQDGEYVVNPRAVSKYSVDFMQALNQERVQVFATGGGAGFAARSTSSAGGDTGGQTLQIVNVISPDLIPKTSDAQIINVISADILRNGQTIKVIKNKIAGN